MLKKTEAGFTLTELLVTLVIASIGILGVAGLQAKSLQLTRDANFRASAIIAANDLLDRVRVNSTQTYALAITDVPPAAAANCAATACTTAQLATMTWLDGLAPFGQPIWREKLIQFAPPWGSPAVFRSVLQA